MAVTVIGGVAVASVFTLLVIPVAYSLLDRKRFAAAPSASPAVDPAGA
jgi:Cu/Ag efflux pump CusA